MVARQKIHAGMIHAGKTATVTCENNHFRIVIDGETAAIVPPHHHPRDPPIQSQRHPVKEDDPMPRITLDTADAAELAETLQLLSDWLAFDPARLRPSLEGFIGHPAYGTAQLRQDLDRFLFLLGGSDGEPLFGP